MTSEPDGYAGCGSPILICPWSQNRFKNNYSTKWRSIADTIPSSSRQSEHAKNAIHWFGIYYEILVREKSSRK